MPPALWETITQQWHMLRTPENQGKLPPLATKAVPDALTPRTQPQAEEMLARIGELPGVRTALLLTPASTIAAWQGPETRDHLQRFCKTRNDLSRPFLTQGRELQPPGQKMFVTFSPEEGMPELEPLQMSEETSANQVLAYHGYGWRLMVVFQDSPAAREQEHIPQRIEEAWQTFLHLLIQRAPD